VQPHMTQNNAAAAIHPRWIGNEALINDI